MQESIFQKLGGIRPMAAKLGVPPSTVKSWHAKRQIPVWRQSAVLAVAKAHKLDVTEAEIINVVPDAPSEQIAA